MSKKRCEVCGEELLQVANYGRGGTETGDFCRNPHPVTRIPGAPNRKLENHTERLWDEVKARDAEADAKRLDWLQNRGRVKARKYGDMKDNWKWDCASSHDLRAAIDAAIELEAADAPKALAEYTRLMRGDK